MNKVFNCPLEISLRFLLILYANEGKGKNLDSILTGDFLTIYGKDFGISLTNLHGDNEFYFSEYVARRNQAPSALKSLLLQGLIQVSPSSHGFLYSISDLGKKVCLSMTTEYSKVYLTTASKTLDYLKDKDEEKLIAKLSKEAAQEVQRR